MPLCPMSKRSIIHLDDTVAQRYSLYWGLMDKRDGPISCKPYWA